MVRSTTVYVSVTQPIAPGSITLSSSAVSITLGQSITLSGTVFSTSGTRMSGVTVYLNYQNPAGTITRKAASAVSDANGNFSWSFTPNTAGSWIFWASTDSLTSNSVTVNVAQPTTVASVSLSASPTSGRSPLNVTFSGSVKSSTGTGIANKTVYLYVSDSTGLIYSNYNFATVTTDANGNFSTSYAFGAGTYYVYATADGVKSNTVTIVVTGGVI